MIFNFASAPPAVRIALATLASGAFLIGLAMWLAR